VRALSISEQVPTGHVAHLRPRRPRAGEVVPLRQGYAEAGDRLQLLQRLDTLGQQPGVDPTGEGTQHLDQ
jgi:hypothetical protein